MADNFDVNIRTKADTTGAKQTTDALKGIKDQANQPGKAGFLEGLQGQFSGLASKIPGVGGLLDGAGSALARFAMGPVGIAVAAIGALTAAFQLASKALNEYAEGQVKMTELDAALAAQGKLTDDFREKLQGLASQLQETTGIADDQWFPVFSQLVKFGADESNIEKYTDAVKNLAGILGGDINTAALLFSRAMQGNFQMFSRYGIVVEKAGTQTEKLDLLMQQLANRGAGILEAKSRTVSGQFQQLTNTTADLFEAFGRLISKTEIVQRTLGAMTFFLKFWGDALGGSIEQVDGLSNKIQELDNTSSASKASADRLAKAMREIESGATAANEALQTQIKTIQALAKAQDEIANAEMALELAQIDASDDSDMQKMQKKNAVRKRFAQEDFQRDQAAEQEKINANKQAIDDSAGRLGAADQNVSTQRKKVDRAGEFDAVDSDLMGSLNNAASGKTQAQERLARAKVAAQMDDSWIGTVTDGVQNEIDSAEKEVAVYEKVQAQLEAKRKANQDARKGEGIGNTDEEVKSLTDLEAKTKALSDEISKQNKERLGNIRTIQAEITQREKLNALKTKTDEVTNNAAVTKAQSEADSKSKIEALKLEIDKIKASGGDATAKEKEMVDLQTPKDATPGRAAFDKEQLEKRNREEREKQQQEEAKKLGGQAAGVATTNAVQSPGGGQDETTTKINAAVEKLGDGASASELTGVADSLQTLADAVITKDQQRGQEIDNLIAKIDQLASQIKSNR